MARFSPTISRILVAATALGLAVPAAAYAAAPGQVLTAEAPRPVTVIPPDPAQSVPYYELKFAGASGFLSAPSGSADLIWTSYATGKSTLVPQLAGGRLIMPAGPDTVWTWSPYAGVTPPGQANVFDLDTMKWSLWTVPAGDTQLGANGDSVLVQSGSGASAQLEILTFTSATPTTTAVTGLPAGAEPLGRGSVDDGADAAVVTYSLSGSAGYGYGLLDWATGVVTPFASSADLETSILTPAIAALSDGTTGVLSAYKISDLAASPSTVTLPKGYVVALAGDHAIGLPIDATCATDPPCPMPTAVPVDVPLSGAPAGTAVPLAESDGIDIVEGTGVSALLVGGSGPADWAVRQFDVNGQDSLTDTIVQPVTYPLANAGLSISQGLVQHVEAGPALGQAPPQYWLSSHALDPGTLGPGSFQPPLDGGALFGVLPCLPSASCVELADPTLQGTPYLESGSELSLWLQALDGGVPWAEPLTAIPSASASIVDSSPGFVIVDGSHPSRLYIVTATYGAAKVTTRPLTAAALWFDTLWSADGRGRLQASNLVTKSESRPVSTGVRCTVTALQATQRWLYWSCGASGPAGVYDLQRHVDVRVPAGPLLLGDGYLIRQSGSDLLMYDVYSDQLTGPVTVTTDVATVPGSDGRNVTFAVDKYSGDIAYVNPDDDIVVVSSGVPATAPAFATVSFAAHPGLIWFGSGGAWSADLGLSRPVSAWTLVVRQASTGRVVFEQRGGATRMGLTVSWNGYLRHHRQASAGAYTWSLVVGLAGTASRYTIRGGTLTVR